MKHNPLEKLMLAHTDGILFRPKRTREHTLSVDERTHKIITDVAEQTGQTRPNVLAAFVDIAFKHYAEQAVKNGIDPHAPAQGNFKGSRKKNRDKEE